MTNIKMLVAAHKSAAVPTDPMYLPVHVGAALNDADLGYQRDDEGENISSLNRSYCELTALYWAWKNLDADVIGLSHYRRYFRGDVAGPNGSRILSEAEAGSLMSNCDVVLATPRYYVIETIDSHYRNGHHGSDIDRLREVITDGSPQFLKAYNSVFAGRKLSLYNMFMMRRDIFDPYAEWLFSVLGDVESLIENESRSSYQRRTFGYLGERLLNVWAAAHSDELRIVTSRVVNTEGEAKLTKGIGLLKRKLRREA